MRREQAVKLIVEGQWNPQLEAYLQNPLIRVNEKDIATGSTLLQHACAAGHEQAVETLLAYHFNLDFSLEDRLGYTALALACKGGHALVINFLRQQGHQAYPALRVNRPIRARESERVISRASERRLNHRFLKETFLEGFDSEDEAVMTAIQNDSDWEDWIGELNYDCIPDNRETLSSEADDKKRPLYLAVESGNPHAVRAVLKFPGVKVEIKDASGERLLTFAWAEKRDAEAAADREKQRVYADIHEQLRAAIQTQHGESTTGGPTDDYGTTDLAATFSAPASASAGASGTAAAETVPSDSERDVSLDGLLRSINAEFARGDYRKAALYAQHFTVSAYRGVNFSLAYFDTVDRQAYIDSILRGERAQQPLFSEMARLLAGIEGYDEPEDKRDELIDAGERVRQAMIALKKPFQVAKTWGATADRQAFASIFDKLQSRYTTSKDAFTETMWDEFETDLAAFLVRYPNDKSLFDAIRGADGKLHGNPFISFSATPRHAVKYNVGLSYSQANKPNRTAPRFRGATGQTKKRVLGYVSTTQHAPHLFHQSGVSDVMAAFAQGRADAGRYRRERELSFIGYVPGEHMTNPILIAMPDFAKPYKAKYKEIYGLSKRQFQTFKQAITSSVKHSNERKRAKKRLYELLSKHYDGQITVALRQQVEQQGRTMIYPALDGGFAFEPAADETALAQRATSARKRGSKVEAHANSEDEVEIPEVREKQPNRPKKRARHWKKQAGQMFSPSSAAAAATEKDTSTAEADNHLSSFRT